jgi:hypothetical protein
MTNTENITYEQLQEIMELVLDAHINTKITKSYLYSRILDRINYNTFVHPSFRTKFELVYNYYLPQLNDIIVTKNIVQKVGVNLNTNPETLAAETELSDISDADVLKYMIENASNDDFEYINPNGNTFYHECIKHYDIVEKLIKEDKMNYTILNKNQLTPLELIDDVKVSALIINKLNKTINDQEKDIISIKANQFFLFMLIMICSIFNSLF